jgi:hypothetical protein
VYLQPDQLGEVLLASCAEKGVLIPSLVVRAGALHGRSDRETAYLAAKQLTALRPEHYLKTSTPTVTELRTAFWSAIHLAQPQLPIPAEDAPLVQQYLPLLEAKMTPHALAELRPLVQRLAKAKREADLQRWCNAVDATGQRAGFVACDDLETAARLISVEPHVFGAPPAKERIKDLILYSISPDYFAVRRALGLEIEVARQAHARSHEITSRRRRQPRAITGSP